MGVQGLHYYPLAEKLDQAGLIKVENKFLSADGINKIKWSYHGCLSKESTCFPSNWTKETIIQKINEAARNITNQEWHKNGRLELIGQTREGIKIKMIFQFLTDNAQTICKLVSCFPHIENKGI